MQKRRIFIITEFKEETPRSIHIQSAMWIKGLSLLGCDIQRFGYRAEMLNASFLRSRTIAKMFARKKTDNLLVKRIKDFNPDVIFIMGFKYINEQTVLKLREVAPRAVFVCREEDSNPEKYPQRLSVARQTDILVSTSAGKFLKTYKDAGVPCCAFMPNMCDPEIQYRYKVEPKWLSDIVFTGKPTHARLGSVGDRYDLIEKVSKMSGCKVYGSFGVPRVQGLNYFYAISGAKIGLSVNIINDVQMYHSDRLINYLACGTFTLAKRVPDTEKLFVHKKHLEYFDTEEEFFALADWYLRHDSERQVIAQAGMEFAHREYNCTRMASHLMHLIEKGSVDAPWALIL